MSAILNETLAEAPDITGCADDNGFMDAPFRISDHLEARAEDVCKLNRLTMVLSRVQPNSLEEQERRLAAATEGINPHARRIVEHADALHNDLMQAVAARAEAGHVTREGFSNFCVQGWYHTRYTTKFEHMFSEKLQRHLASTGCSLDKVDSHDNKFSLMLDQGIDEEEGHEIWALQDILDVGVRDSIDVLTDVFPETKAIVWSQHDRLTRLPFVGFLGYSFYLEMLIAKRSLGLLQVLQRAFGTQPKDHKFIYYHYVVDQGHAIDNIELLNTLVADQKRFKEVIDNMNFIHTMYKGTIMRSFQN